jgi:hypothetical protein
VIPNSPNTLLDRPKTATWSKQPRTQIKDVTALVMITSAGRNALDHLLAGPQYDSIAPQAGLRFLPAPKASRYSGTANIRASFGATVTYSFPPCNFAVIDLGVTTPGASKVFTLSTLSGVMVSPEPEVPDTPFTSASTSSACSGSSLVAARRSLPEVSFAPIASTRGR